jgi:hypothetical protein
MTPDEVVELLGRHGRHGDDRLVFADVLEECDDPGGAAALRWDGPVVHFMNEWYALPFLNHWVQPPPDANYIAIEPIRRNFDTRMVRHTTSMTFHGVAVEQSNDLFDMLCRLYVLSMMGSIDDVAFWYLGDSSFCACDPFTIDHGKFSTTLDMWTRTYSEEWDRRRRSGLVIQPRPVPSSLADETAKVMLTNGFLPNFPSRVYPVRYYPNLWCNFGWLSPTQETHDRFLEENP